MHILLVVLLVVLVLAFVPRLGYATSYGWAPSGVGGLVLVLFLLWLFFGGGMRHF